MRRTTDNRWMTQQRLHEEPVIIPHIGHDDANEVIPFTRHRVTLDDLRAGVHEILKALSRIDFMAPHSHVAHDIVAAADCFRIDEPHRPTQNSGYFQGQMYFPRSSRLA